MSFSKIALFGRQRPEDNDVGVSLHNCLKILNKRGIKVGIERGTAEHFKLTQEAQFEWDQLADWDLLIVVGGDGSLLQTISQASKANTPVIGINRGKLGFLTDIIPDELESQLSSVIDGQYQSEQRFILNAEIQNQHNPIFQALALNDVVLMPGNTAHLIEFEILIDGATVCQQRADGMIIATPTGSTAYALSGGGPILHPSLNAIALVPMFPHTLSSRPIVVNANSEIAIKIAKHLDCVARVTCDGQPSVAIEPGQSLIINKAHHPLTLIHPKDYDYYQTLRSKLRWENS